MQTPNVMNNFQFKKKNWQFFSEKNNITKFPFIFIFHIFGKFSHQHKMLVEPWTKTFSNVFWNVVNYMQKKVFEEAFRIWMNALSNMNVVMGGEPRGVIKSHWLSPLKRTSLTCMCTPLNLYLLSFDSYYKTKPNARKNSNTTLNVISHKTIQISRMPLHHDVISF